jgi:hypothetical protein
MVAPAVLMPERAALSELEKALLSVAPASQHTQSDGSHDISCCNAPNLQQEGKAPAIGYQSPPLRSTQRKSSPPASICPINRSLCVGGALSVLYFCHSPSTDSGASAKFGRPPGHSALKRSMALMPVL